MQPDPFVFSQRLYQSEAPFSHVARVGELGFVSGLIGQRPADGRLVSGDVAEQCDAMLNNLATLLDEVGTEMRHLVRTTIYLTDCDDFAAINEVYGSRLQPPYPVRTTVQVAGLPLGAAVQIDAVVALGQFPADASCGRGMS
jgi:2-iminobutanoate/2-iminopropanoate deaminase